MMRTEICYKFDCKCAFDMHVCVCALSNGSIGFVLFIFYNNFNFKYDFVIYKINKLNHLERN